MFNADIKHFKTVQEYKDYVATITKPSWVKGVVIHHTWKPVQGDWKGETTMNALKKYYESLHWDAGPHLFLCIGSPNPENDSETYFCVKLENTLGTNKLIFLIVDILA
jgi:hypothetical protein